jgi:hypothetical protein
MASLYYLCMAARALDVHQPIAVYLTLKNIAQFCLTSAAVVALSLTQV